MIYKFNRNAACWCGSGKKYRDCHLDFDRKLQEMKRRGYFVPKHKIIKNEAQIEGIRESGKVNIAVLDYVAEHIAPGITTEEIDRLVYEKTTKLGGIPAPLNYEGFPKSVCVSINNEVCHGIPSRERILEEGDIANVDVSTIYNGFYSDSSRMFCIGKVSEERKRLVEVARNAVFVGLKAVRPWKTLGDMGAAIHSYVRSQGCSVVYDVGGHGVGLEFHEEPYVSYVTKPGTEMVMAPGMVFTIEPMINAGAPDVYIDDENDWTIYTDDDSDSAQWEVTVVVRDNEKGYEILAD